MIEQHFFTEKATPSTEILIRHIRQEYSVLFLNNEVLGAISRYTFKRVTSRFAMIMNNEFLNNHNTARVH